MKIPKLHHVWQRTQKRLLGKPSKAATFFVSLSEVLSLLKVNNNFCVGLM